MKRVTAILIAAAAFVGCSYAAQTPQHFDLECGSAKVATHPTYFTVDGVRFDIFADKPYRMVGMSFFAISESGDKARLSVSKAHTEIYYTVSQSAQRATCKVGAQ